MKLRKVFYFSFCKMMVIEQLCSYRNEIIFTCYHHARNGRLNITAIVIYLLAVRPTLPKEGKKPGIPQRTRDRNIFFLHILKPIELVTKNHYIHSRTHAHAYTQHTMMKWASFENWNWRKQKWSRPRKEEKNKDPTHWNWVSSSSSHTAIVGWLFSK